MLDSVVTTGRATWSQDMGLFYDRKLRKEEVFVTFRAVAAAPNRSDPRGALASLSAPIAVIYGTQRHRAASRWWWSASRSGGILDLPDSDAGRCRRSWMGPS
jgi:hypothetical protein